MFMNIIKNIFNIGIVKWQFKWDNVLLFFENKNIKQNEMGDIFFSFLCFKRINNGTKQEK